MSEVIVQYVQPTYPKWPVLAKLRLLRNVSILYYRLDLIVNWISQTLFTDDLFLR